jgi:hypothetical protein
MARPHKNPEVGRKSISKSIRLAPVELAQVRAIAKHYGIPTSEYIRSVAIAKAASLGK